MKVTYTMDEAKDIIGAKAVGDVIGAKDVVGVQIIYTKTGSHDVPMAVEVELKR